MRKMYNNFVLAILIILNISCGNDDKFSDKYCSLELHRNMIIEEYLHINKAYENNKLKNTLNEMFNLKYEVPDTISSIDPRMIYINENPNVPDFIKKALIEEFEVEFMSIGEFYLANQKIAKELRITYPYNLNSVVFPTDKITIGYEKYYNKEKGMIQTWYYWEFKNGFLWEWGII